MPINRSREPFPVKLIQKTAFLIPAFLTCSLAIADFDCVLVNDRGTDRCMGTCRSLQINCGGTEGLVSPLIVSLDKTTGKVHVTGDTLKLYDTFSGTPCRGPGEPSASELKYSDNGKCSTWQEFRGNSSGLASQNGDVQELSVKVPGCDSVNLSYWMYPQLDGTAIGYRFCKKTGRTPPAFSDCNELTSKSPTAPVDASQKVAMPTDPASSGEDPEPQFASYDSASVGHVRFPVTGHSSCDKSAINLCLGGARITKQPSDSLVPVDVGMTSISCVVDSQAGSPDGACPSVKDCAADQNSTFSDYTPSASTRGSSHGGGRSNAGSGK